MRLRPIVTAGLAAAIVTAVTVIAAQPAYAATATFVRTSSWSTGYEAKFTITNNTTTTITSWNVQFDLPAGTSISSLWDGIRSQSGQHVTVVNTSWNGTLGPGATASFGFVAAGTGDPTNCTVNGGSCSGGSPPPPGVPGAPSNLRVTGTTNSSISLAWNASSGTVSGYRVFEGTTQRAQVTGLSATLSGLATCSSHTYTVRAFNANGQSAASNAVTASTTGCTTPPPSGAMAAAPYLYLGWGNPPSATSVMSSTGIRWYTMAFVLSGGGCVPAWDSVRPLTGGVDQQTISAIKAAGGDIIPSFGGWSGNKLGPNCSTPQALANAYQQVINAYSLKAIDIDIENTDEFESEVVQDRILNALKIVKQSNPGIRTIITFGTTTSGPNFWGTRLINRSRDLAVNIDVYTIMPFDFGCSGNMFTCTTTASDGLRNALKTAFGWNDDTAYRHMGISGMNGLSDQQELTTLQHWTDIRNWAQTRHLARLAFWSVNRDRPCPGGGVQSACSGIDQPNFEFTRITARYTP